MASKVVITGLGVLSPNGVGQDEYCDALRAGKSGIRRIEQFDTAKLNAKIAGYIDTSLIEARLPDPEALERHDRATIFSLIASEMARADAHLDDLENLPGRKGVIVGTAYGPIQSIEWAYERSWAQKMPYIKPSMVPRTMFNSASSEVAIHHGLQRFNQTVSTACSSSLLALALGYQAVRDGQADLVFAGGVDCPVLLEFFRLWDASRLLARESNDQPERASRPFDLNRSGMVLSEGCGFVVLESAESARNRKADAYAEIIGIGQSNDANQIMSPRANTQAQCMLEALTEAQVGVGDISHIQAHATSVPLNDASECAAIQQVFGDEVSKIPVSSIKSMVGHTLGASGILSVIAVLLGIRDSFIPPTINYEEPDPQCPINVVANEPKRQRLNTALVNSFGFGGSNVSVVVRRP